MEGFTLNGINYYQQSRSCGKCKICLLGCNSHGPYWYWREVTGSGKMHYIGRELPFYLLVASEEYAALLPKIVEHKTKLQHQVDLLGKLQQGKHLTEEDQKELTQLGYGDILVTPIEKVPRRRGSAKEMSQIEQTVNEVTPSLLHQKESPNVTRELVVTPTVKETDQARPSGPRILHTWVGLEDGSFKDFQRKDLEALDYATSSGARARLYTGPKKNFQAAYNLHHKFVADWNDKVVEWPSVPQVTRVKVW